MICFPFLRQFGSPHVFLPWSPCLHLKLIGATLVLFSVNLAPLTFSSPEPLLALETEWRPSRPFLRQFGAHEVFFPGAPSCTWNCMAPLSSFSQSIWRPWRFLPWSPCLHLKLHGAPLVLFSVNLAPLTFSSLEPLLALETAWRPSRPFLRQFGAPDIFFPGSPTCTWNCMAPLSSFLRQFGAPGVFFPGAPTCTWTDWRPSRPFLRQFGAPDHFLPWIPYLHLKLFGAPLVLFSVNLAPLTFSSLIPYLHLKLHGASLVLFSVNLAPLTFSSLEPLLALETEWRPSRPFLRQFGAPDVYLPWSPYLHLKLHGAPLVLFSVNLARLTFSSLDPLLALETAWRPSRHIDLNFFLSFSFLLPLSSLFSFLFPSFPLFSSFPPLSFFSFPFFFLFGAPLVTPGGPGPQSPPPPKIRPWNQVILPDWAIGLDCSP